MRKLATVLSNRAAAFIPAPTMGRRRVRLLTIRLDITQVKAYARGSAALTHLGMSRRAVELAELGLASAKPRGGTRGALELPGLSVKICAHRYAR